MAYNIDSIKNPLSVVVMDAAMRQYSNYAFQAHDIPNVGINNRFIYSPRTIIAQSTALGLIDKSPIIPYTYDTIAAYATLRDYQKTVILSKKNMGGNTQLSGHPVDFTMVYASQSPPYLKDNFVNGARGCDLNDHVENAIDYAVGTGAGQFERTNFYTPLRYVSDNFYWESFNDTNEVGLKCGSVYITKKLDWTGTATDYGDKIEYELSGSYESHYLPASIDGMLEGMSLSGVSYADFNMPPLSSGIQENYWNPYRPPNDGILDFMVKFIPVRQTQYRTDMTITAEMPLELIFSNFTELSMELNIPIHAYNYYYYKRNNGNCANDSRNPLEMSTYDESVARAWMDCRSMENTFYDFGTGMQYVDPSYVYPNSEGYTINRLNIPPKTNIMISIDVNNVLRRDSFTSESFHQWYYGNRYVDGEPIPDTINPYNLGCYGFWINLNECSYRLII